ncbi:unnamed protein product [Phytomonas sp. EM1]|nr:unnamed protein product [Phytomonas sp. EM1]|eukprot:CCW60690.1 unnamed protein product [Phytomonas sp. isolate EM1]
MIEGRNVVLRDHFVCVLFLRGELLPLSIAHVFIILSLCFDSLDPISSEYSAGNTASFTKEIVLGQTERVINIILAFSHFVECLNF